MHTVLSLGWKINKLLSCSLEILYLPRELNRAGAHTRIVALSATPGADVPSVKQVLQNLFISKIELRHEESEDIVPYTHHRNVDKIVVPLDEDLVSVRNKLLSVQVLYLRGLSWIATLSVLLNRKSMSRSWLQLMLWGKVTTHRATPSLLSSTQGTNGVRTLLEVFQTMFEDRWNPLKIIEVECLCGPSRAWPYHVEWIMHFNLLDGRMAFSLQEWTESFFSANTS